MGRKYMSGAKFSKRVFVRSKFRGKERIYVRVDGVVNVSQLWVWDAKRKRYCTPKFGRKFEARRYEVDGFGGGHRKKQYIETSDNALEWLGISSSKAPVAAGSAVELISLEGRGTCPAKRPRSKSVPTFAGVVESLREYAYPMLFELLDARKCTICAIFGNLRSDRKELTAKAKSCL
jgi:hypothetical protein